MNIIIVGNGGHSKVIQEMVSLIKEHQVIAILDDKYTSEFHVNGTVHGPLTLLDQVLEQDGKVIIAIGNNLTRRHIVASLNLEIEQFLTIIHPTAIVSSTARLGYGTVIMPNAVINAETMIGDHCIINTGAIVEHENVVGDYTHISPNATLTGNVFVGEGVHIGATATIIPGMKVGNWSVIGAGSIVIKEIPAGSKAVGSPARILSNNKLNKTQEEKVVVINDKT
ncbi:acetyltransferase [Aquibacillus saliphilus]|uniref:acetyltransferase n=1 Tax=Aquibacillus saliphilus TaxID=1909422 RepID=UPI001CF00F1B|nr:acetyltransferase [Aquibacillus saliphilus]